MEEIKMTNNTNELKGVAMVWLSKTDLSNLNAGAGGGGNITELKTYDNGRKPYASGQSVRHALREAIHRNNPGVFLCVPETPCTNVAECWLCDLFGFLNPIADKGFDRRWSPIKATPALGQIASDVVTDLLIRMSGIEREDRKTTDQRIAYVQIMANVYRVGLSLDVANVGKVITPQYEGKGKNATFKEWETTVEIDKEKKIERTIAVLEAIGGIADFAKQARNAASLAPDIFIASTHSRYSHRTLRALELDDDGNVNTESLRVILQDLKDDGAKLFCGFTPGVVENDDELKDLLKNFEIKVSNPIRALMNLKADIHKALTE
ncbi:DevR family CRISPR-associated autoregulator [Candidatus Poribacteria bacterium]|nr:DevR family CRISPR-associated autoregulator [Candidatus Poribacteria bacterium]MYB63671.1 DevR family CRISPR-associated autoregulator [Candidatus Poribacteria bacterium]